MNWEVLVASWSATIEAIEKVGAYRSEVRSNIQYGSYGDIIGRDPVGLYIAPPADTCQIESVEEEIGIEIPRSLRKFFCDYSAAIYYRWQLESEIRLNDFPCRMFSGGFQLSLDSLIGVNRRGSSYETMFDDKDSDYDKVWDNRFYFMNGSSGNFYTFQRDSRESDEVTYVSCNDEEGHGFVLGEDFLDFMWRWSAIGCPGPHSSQWVGFTSSMSSFIEPNGDRAQRWRQAIGLELDAEMLVDIQTRSMT